MEDDDENDLNELSDSGDHETPPLGNFSCCETFMMGGGGAWRFLLPDLEELVLSTEALGPGRNSAGE